MSVLKVKMFLFLQTGICLLTACRHQTVSLETGEVQYTDETYAQTEEYRNYSEHLIYVYVCGSVCAPGVYMLNEGARCYQALDLAGGADENACLDGMNLAAVITDGERIYVPSADECTDVLNENVVVSVPEDPRIDLNHAGRDELMTLPGIGETRADAIIYYREHDGLFRQIEDIQNVPGIKEGTYEKIKALIRIG